MLSQNQYLVDADRSECAYVHLLLIFFLQLHYIYFHHISSNPDEYFSTPLIFVLYFSHLIPLIRVQKPFTIYLSRHLSVPFLNLFPANFLMCHNSILFPEGSANIFLSHRLLWIERIKMVITGQVLHLTLKSENNVMCCSDCCLLVGESRDSEYEQGCKHLLIVMSQQSL